MFQFFQTSSETLRSMFFLKDRLKMTSLRIEKHRIVKKSEHRPPLLGDPRNPGPPHAPYTPPDEVREDPSQHVPSNTLYKFQ